MQVSRTVIILCGLSIAFSALGQQARKHGALSEDRQTLRVWHNQANWVSPDQFFELELKRLGGPTYGTVTTYPAYDNVSEWETLIDQLPDGRTCPMVFFHQRWRRLPDVLGLHSKLRNYGGCADVFDF